MFTNVYSEDGFKCPKEDAAFQNRIEFQDQSQNTIVTKVEYFLSAIDKATGQILFNVTKSDLYPHFNQITKSNLLGY